VRAVRTILPDRCAGSAALTLGAPRVGYGPGSLTAPSPAQIAALADAAGHPLPPERIGAVGEAFAEIMALAMTLDDLPLEGVEPALGPGGSASRSPGE
jgi:hypothetical protein